MEQRHSWLRSIHEYRALVISQKRRAEVKVEVEVYWPSKTALTGDLSCSQHKTQHNAIQYKIQHIAQHNTQVRPVAAAGTHCFKEHLNE